MMGDSVWYPGTVKGAIFVLVILVMVVLHESSLVGLMGSTTQVFGWLPAQLAYDMAYHLVGVVFAYILYRYSPEPRPEFEPTVGADVSGGSAAEGDG